VAEEFGRNYATAQQVLTTTTEDELRVDIANQILANSLVCKTKADRFRPALFTMAFALLCWFAAVSLHFTVQRSVSASSQRSAPSSGQEVHEHEMPRVIWRKWL
jgi:hypothetical protein